MRDGVHGIDCPVTLHAQLRYLALNVPLMEAKVRPRCISDAETTGVGGISFRGILYTLNKTITRDRYDHWNKVLLCQDRVFEASHFTSTIMFEAAPSLISTRQAHASISNR